MPVAEKINMALQVNCSAACYISSTLIITFDHLHRRGLYDIYFFQYNTYFALHFYITIHVNTELPVQQYIAPAATTVNR
jgi:hypothetical protein